MQYMYLVYRVHCISLNFSSAAILDLEMVSVLANFFPIPVLTFVFDLAPPAQDELQQLASEGSSAPGTKVSNHTGKIGHSWARISSCSFHRDEPTWGLSSTGEVEVMMKNPESYTPPLTVTRY